MNKKIDDLVIDSNQEEVNTETVDQLLEELLKNPDVPSVIKGQLQQASFLAMSVGGLKNE